MRILTIAATPYFSDRGCHIRVFLEAKYLKRKGVDVSLCTYHLGKDVGDFSIKRIGDVSWYKKTSPGFAWGKLWLDLKLLLLCIKEIKRFKPDAIHAHLFEGLVIGYLAKMLAGKRGVPVVVDLQGDLRGEMESYNKKNGFAKSVFVWLSKRAIRLADFVVVSGENAFSSFERLTKDKNKIEIVKDGIDLELFGGDALPEKDTQAELENLRTWKGDRKLLIYAGGMEDSKGAKDLLEEFLKSRQGLSDWVLALYGNGKDKGSYQELVKEGGAEDLIFFVKENGYFVLPQFLEMADVAIDPKKDSTESSGKLVNYMAAGLPVICFESEFNRARLGERGFYLQKMSDLENVLETGEISKKEYNLTIESEEKEVEKMLGIFEKIIDQKT